MPPVEGVGNLGSVPEAADNGHSAHGAPTSGAPFCIRVIPSIGPQSGWNAPRRYVVPCHLKHGRGRFRTHGRRRERVFNLVTFH